MKNKDDLEKRWEKYNLDYAKDHEKKIQKFKVNSKRFSNFIVLIQLKKYLK